MKHLFVLINGLEDLARGDDDSNAKANNIRTGIISELWPEAGVRVFDFLADSTHSSHVNYAYFLNYAQDIIDQLNSFVGAPTTVVFLAHSTGAALVKKILLLALQQPSSQWLALWAVAVHFFDSPEYYEYHQWTRHLVRILGNEKLDFLDIPGIFNGLPTALCQIEFEFANIAQAFKIHHHHTQDSVSHLSTCSSYGRTLPKLGRSCSLGLEEPNTTSRTLWDFHDDFPQYLDILYSVERLLHNCCRDELMDYESVTRKPLWEFQEIIALPEAPMGWLVPVCPLLTIPKYWLDMRWDDIAYWMLSHKSEVLLMTDNQGFASKHLSSYIIARLRTKQRTDKAATLILSYDINPCDVRQNTERSLLYSLIRQILVLRPNSCRNIEALIQRISRSDMPYLPCGLLWGLLSTLLQSIEDRRVFLIIHGVDQHLQHVAHRLSALLVACNLLISKSLKILITSCERLVLPQDVQRWQFALGNADCRDIVSEVVEKKLSTILRQAPAWQDSKLDILEKIDGEEATQLTAFLNLSILEQSTTPATEEAIQFWLSKPFTSPEETLHAMINGLRDIASTRTILSWVSYAVRPLTVPELAVVVALQELTLDHGTPSDQAFDSLATKVSSNLARDLEGALGRLITIDSNQRVGLVYSTLRKYMDQSEHGALLLSDHHLSISRQCLQYLTLCSHHNPGAIPAPRPVNRAFAFLDYSQRYWVRHYILAQPPNEELDRQVFSFFTSPLYSRAFSLWVDKYWANLGKKTKAKEEGNAVAEGEKQVKKEKGDMVTNDPLLLAIRLGLSRIIQMILESEGRQLQPERLGHALRASARSPESQALKDILAIASSDVDLVPVLCEAAAHGSTECVELLLDRMANSWAKYLNTIESGGGRNPLLLAASGGHTSTVELLITRGSSILSVDSEGNTALHLASQIGDYDTLAVMEKLRGDDFNTARLVKSAKEDLTPFRLACRVGSLAAFDILFKDDEKGLISLSPPARLPKAAGEILAHVTDEENLATIKKILLYHEESSRLPLPAIDILADINNSRNLVIIERILLSYPEPLPAADILADVTNSGNLAIIQRVLLESENSIRWAMGLWARGCFSVACMKGYYDVVRLFVKTELKSISAEIDSTEIKHRKKALNERIRQGIHLAIEKFDDEMVVWLWEKMDAPCPEDYFETALWAGNLSMLDYLLSRDKSVGYDFATEEGMRNWIQAVRDALYFASLDTLRYLLKVLKGAKYAVDQSWDTLNDELVILFIRAVRRGHVACLRELFREVFSHFSMSGAWGTILETAVEESIFSCLEEVLKWQPTNIYFSTSFSERILRLAIERQDDQENRLKRVRLLLASGISASTGVTGWQGRVPPLHVAVERGITDVVELLLQHGASANMERLPLQTPMHVAMQRGKPGVLYLLLRHGGDPNAVDWEGRGSLHIAIHRQDTKLVDLLLEPWADNEDPRRGADDVEKRRHDVRRRAPRKTDKFPDPKHLIRPDVDKRVSDDRRATPLILAAEDGLVDIIRMLLRAGANPNLPETDGYTPLYTILVYEHKNGRPLEGTRLLLKYGGDPNIHGGRSKCPLQSAADQRREGQPYDDRPSRLDALNGLPLNAAIWWRSIEVSRLLLNSGAAADVLTPFLGTPLHILMRVRLHTSLRYFEMTMKLLLQRGADVDAQDSNGFTPLMMYICCHLAHPLLQYRSPPTHLETLISKTRSPRTVNIFGRTALHYAASCDVPPTAVEGLLAAGAHPLTRDKLGHTPLYYSLLCDGTDDVEHDSEEKITGWLACFSTLLNAIPLKERPRQLSEALLAAVKTGLESRLDAILGEVGKGHHLDLTIHDNSGYTALDIAILFGSDEGGIFQKLLAVEGKVQRIAIQKKIATKWSENDRNENYHVSEDGMEVSFTAIPVDSRPVLVVGAVRADHPIPVNQGPVYFELEVLELPDSDEFFNCVAVGFQTEQASLDKLVGWERASWGYHSDDGFVYSGNKHVYGQNQKPYNEGDTVGVLIDPSRQRARFRNEDGWTGYWFYGVVGQLYPAVSLQIASDCNARVKVNFGKEMGSGSWPFKYAPLTDKDLEYLEPAVNEDDASDVDREEDVESEEKEEEEEPDHGNVKFEAEEEHPNNATPKIGER